VIEDGKVREVHVEPDNTGISGTLAPETLCVDGNIYAQ
jgi:hypothetical protein